MKEYNMEDLIPKAKNKFLLSNALAGRAKQISEGSLPYMDVGEMTSPILIAMQELGDEKSKIRVLDGPRAKVERPAFDREEHGPSLEKEQKKKKKA